MLAGHHAGSNHAVVVVVVVGGILGPRTHQEGQSAREWAAQPLHCCLRWSTNTQRGKSTWWWWCWWVGKLRGRHWHHQSVWEQHDPMKWLVD